MSTISLAYVSSAIHPMTNDALRDLLSSARKKNKGFDITGMLLYRDSFFIQVLEGEPEYVTIVYNRSKSKTLEIPISAASYGAFRNFILRNGFCRTRFAAS